MAEKRFIKGLFKDTGHIDQPEGSWRHAKNMVINKTDGAVSNEGGTELSGHLGISPFVGAQNDKVIGAIEVNDDRAILFVTDVVTPYDPPLTIPRSEIGIWENGVYTVLFNPVLLKLTNDLNFRETHPIEGTFKIDPKGDLIIYFTDDLNPPRAFNVDRQLRESANVGQLYGILPGDLDNIDILNLFPYSGPVPHIDINDQGTHQGCIIEGGGLLTGVYYLALAYVDDDLVATNFLTVSNPISIVDEFDSTTPTNKKDGAREGSQTTKAIQWDVSNLNVDYKYLRPVVIRSKGEAQEAFKLKDIDFPSSGVKSIIFSGLETSATGSVADVIIDTIAYDTAKTIQQLDNVLYLGNTTRSIDLDYQKYANNIKLRSKVKDIENFDEFYASIDNIQTGWGSRAVNDFGGTVQSVDPTKSYRYIPNIFKWKGYMRDEIYAFYIAFILKDGSMSYAYHIPGRESLDDERLKVSSLNGTSYGGLWEDIQNVSPEYGKRFHWIDSTVDSASAGNYTLSSYMGMNYWENSTEFYPETSNYEVWDETGNNPTLPDLKGKNVRHHHFPSNRHKDRKTIKDHNCETTISSGTTPPVNPFVGHIFKEYGTGQSDVTLGCNWSRTRWNNGPNNDFVPDNDPTWHATLFDPGPDMFIANQPMQVRTRWEVWYHECGPAETVETRCRIQYADGSPTQTLGSMDSISSFGVLCCGIGQGGCEDANRQYNYSGWTTLAPGDRIYIEHRCRCSTAGGCAHQEGNIGGVCGGSYPGSLTSSCTSNGVIYRMLSYWDIDFKTVGSPPPDPKLLLDAKISHDVRALGFELEDVKIPQSIADKIQGFRIYHANRKHSDRTVLGQSIALPAQYKTERLGICKEAATTDGASQVLSTLQDLREPFYNMDPYPKTWYGYEQLPHFDEGGGPTNPVGAIIDDSALPAHNIYSFHDFYLLRTKNSLAAATHIDIQYKVENLVWNGPGLNQDKRMVTQLTIPSTVTDPISVREIWGWDADQNCYPKEISSGIFMGCKYQPIASRTMPRLIGQKAKTYLLGDSIFKGEALGFGGKLFNEFGESKITFKLMDNHAISAYTYRNYPLDDTIGVFAAPYPNPEHGHVGRPHEGEAILTTELDSSGNFLNSGHQKSKMALVNLKAFKTDVYKSIDSQELVWTGFEVLGEDLDNYVFDDDAGALIPGSTYKTDTTHPDGIFGGDTYICRYGLTTSLKASNEDETSVPRKAIHYHIVESTDNINFRHTEDANSFYFPGTTAKTLLTDAGLKDFTHFDNLRYNDNYSLLNNIRPAFPLPLRDTIQDDFPTRTHRSAKHDTTSIIDNYRVFLANQFRDLPKNRGDLWKLASFNNLLYFHMEESLFAAQGKQTMQMGDGSEAFVGSGDIFQQEPNEIVQTEGGFGGTQSQWASLTTRYGYFFVDKPNNKVFMMKDSLLEISNIGLEAWFVENMPFALEQYGLSIACGLDNPIDGFGFHSTYDPKFKRIILTKREFVPTEDFIKGFETTTIAGPCTAHPEGKIKFFKDTCEFKKWGLLKGGGCGWSSMPLVCHSTYFNCKGWTISYYPEMGIWGSFHDYVPYIYFNTSNSFYSLTDKYIRPVWTSITPLSTWEGTTYGNAGIWKHNADINYGVLYQENTAERYTTAEYETRLNHYSFEIEFIHNEFKAEDTLLSSINYTLETFNQAGISILQHGFTTFFIYNTFQLSGENKLEYFVNTRRVGNNWKINKFRDMADIALNTDPYYMSLTSPNIIGGTNTGTITSSDTENMFDIDGMTKTINAQYLDLSKTWNLQRKFMDKWVGIRLIYNNISNNLLNLYSSDIGVRKIYR